MSRLLLLLPAAALLGGCGSGPPEVEFTAGEASATVGPAQYCDVELTSCTPDPEALAVLPVPAGAPLVITVPDAVGETPWQVVFRYRAGGEVTDGRTEVFGAGERSEYTLRTPEGGQLEAVEVQQFGVPAVVAGEPTFPVRATWELRTR